MPLLQEIPQDFIEVPIMTELLDLLFYGALFEMWKQNFDRQLKIVLLAFLLISSAPLQASPTADDLGRAKDLVRLKSAYQGLLTETQLAPAGFKAVQKAAGDLNGDGIFDVAMILHREGPVQKESSGESEESYEWPQFVVVFEGVSKTHFKLWNLGDHHFVNANPNQMSENGLVELSIRKNVLTIASDFAMSMGSWSAGGCAQKWRKGKAGLELIGLTVNHTDRKCGECGSYRDINFSTQKEILKKISEDPENPKTTQKTSRIKEKPILWDDFFYEKRCSEP